jgi:WD40 repeat protein
MRACSLLFLLIALPTYLGMASCQPPAEEKGPDGKGDSVGQKPTAKNTMEPLPLSVRVSAAAFSLDNKYLLTGFIAGQKLLTLWEAATGQEIRSLAGHSDWVMGVAFVGEGKKALSVSRDGRLLLHDLGNGKLLRSLQPYKELVSLAASADGKLAISVGVDQESKVMAKLWDPEGPTLLRSFEGPGQAGLPLALSPDKKWALSTSPLRLWDLATGKLAHTLAAKEGWGGPVAAFSPDSKFALVMGWKLPTGDQVHTRLALWDVRSGKIVRLLEGAGGPLAVFAAAGKQVVEPLLVESRFRQEFVLGENLPINFWDVNTGKVARSMGIRPPRTDFSQRLFFSGDGRLALLTAGFVFEGPQPRIGTPVQSSLVLAIWDLDTGRLVRQWTRPRAD